MPDVQINVTAAVDDAVSGLNRAAGSMTEMMSTVNLAKTYFSALNGVVQETVGKTVDYANKVENLTQTIGATSEEASKLINVSNEVGISSETLTHALDAAIKKGVRPTIEGMGQLADQYVAIQDPIQRTKFLMETFGKSGAQLADLMEKGSAGIKKMGDESAATGLVMNDKAIAAAKEYEISSKKLTETLDGLEVSIGSRLIPFLTQAADATFTLVNMNTQIQQALQAHSDALITADLSYQDYVTEMNRSAESAGRVAITQEEYNKRISEGGLAALSAKEAIVILSDAQRQAAAATKAAAAATDAATAADTAWVQSGNAVNVIQASINEKLDEHNKKLGEDKTALDKVTAAQAALKSSQDGWLSGTAGEVESALQKAGVKGGEYVLALDAIDNAYGTNTANEAAHQKAVDDLAKAYATHKITAEELQTKLGELATTTMPGMDTAFLNNSTGANNLATAYGLVNGVLTTKVPPAIAGAQQSFEGFGAALKKQYDPGGQIPIYIIGLNQIEAAAKAAGDAIGKIPELAGPTGGSPDQGAGSGVRGPAGGSGGQRPVVKSAGGSDFIVPPGYPDDSFLMAVESDEHVQVTPAGQSGGGNNYYLTINNPRVDDWNLQADWALAKAMG